MDDLFVMFVDEECRYLAAEIERLNDDRIDIDELDALSGTEAGFCDIRAVQGLSSSLSPAAMRRLDDCYSELEEKQALIQETRAAYRTYLSEGIASCSRALVQLLEFKAEYRELEKLLRESGNSTQSVERLGSIMLARIDGGAASEKAPKSIVGNNPALEIKWRELMRQWRAIDLDTVERALDNVPMISQ